MAKLKLEGIDGRTDHQEWSPRLFYDSTQETSPSRDTARIARLTALSRFHGSLCIVVLRWWSRLSGYFRLCAPLVLFAVVAGSRSMRMSTAGALFCVTPAVRVLLLCGRCRFRSCFQKQIGRAIFMCASDGRNEVAAGGLVETITWHLQRR